VIVIWIIGIRVNENSVIHSWMSISSPSLGALTGKAHGSPLARKKRRQFDADRMCSLQTLQEDAGLGPEVRQRWPIGGTKYQPTGLSQNL
jgi:hypothetical protein